MNDYKVVKEVKKRDKPTSKILLKVILALIVVFLLLGIVFTTGYMLFAFLFAALYIYFSRQVGREYEYILENGIFYVDVIRGRAKRKRAHEINLKDIEVVAPNWHEEVAVYRRDTGSVKLPKYDYTSYDDNIPYYTMITMENKKKIKLLLDLDSELLDYMKRAYPKKIFL